MHKKKKKHNTSDKQETIIITCNVLGNVPKKKKKALIEPYIKEQNLMCVFNTCIFKKVLIKE